MKISKSFTVTTLLAFAVIFISSCNNGGEIPSGSDQEWKVYRGTNISLPTSNEELDEVLAITGINLLRLEGPYVSKEPPYDFIESSFQHLDRVLDWGEQNNVRIAIDPHTTPGTRSRWTIYPEDELWLDRSLWDHLIKVWVRISNEQKHRGDVIYGYDLLNEPAIPDPSIHGDQWNEMVAILVDTIRALGDEHTIIVEPTFIRLPGGGHKDRIDALEDLILPDDDNLIVSPHIYDPFLFTHQGVNNNPDGVPYPGISGGKYWDKDELSKTMQPIRDFQKKHGNIRVFMGEFSSSRAGGEDSDVYLKDLIDLFEEENWDWAYHSFRGGGMWDPEMPVGTNMRQPRDPNTPRMQLLRDFYSRNKN